jgi:hypothetical protein
VVFNAICPLPINAQMRQYIHSSLKEYKLPNLICTILLTETNIIDICKAKGVEVRNTDILLIQNIIQA